jgi:regulator of sirC expression with transglutaminase-like and TPR domain
MVILRLLLLVCCFVATPVCASATWLSHVDAWLAMPEEQVDLAAAKLGMDRLLDPRVDTASSLRRIDGLALAARARMPQGTSMRPKVEALLSTLHVPGPWNDHRPFQYDLDDPFARRDGSRLLSTYLDTRRGNCVTMPVLLVILGRRLGLQLHLARAPHHLFVKFQDEDGAWWNIEATAGGYKRDESYVRDTGISPRALETGIYLRPLHAREAVATLSGDLANALRQRGDDTAALALSERALAVDPRDVGAMVRIGSIHARAIERRFHARWADASDVPAALHAEYRALSQANAHWFASAEALGWQQPSPESEAHYLRAIEAEKRRRGNAP